MKQLKLATLLFGALAPAVFANNALAVVAAPACLGNNNLVCVTETYYAEKNVTQYSITNNSAERIYGFGVTSNVQGETATGYPVVDGLNVWDSAQYTSTLWDGYLPQDIDPYRSPYSQYIGFQVYFAHVGSGNDFYATGGWTNLPNRTTDLNTTLPMSNEHIGTFADLFGTDDHYVNFYYNMVVNSDLNTQLNPGDTLDSFYFIGTPNSQFVAFGATGNVIASSLSANTAAVPEPETYAMFMAGLGLMGFVARRRKV